MNEHGSEPSLQDPSGHEPPGPQHAPASPFEGRHRRLQELPQRPVVKRAIAMCAFDRDTDPDELRRKCRHTDAAAIEQVTQYLVFRAKTRAAWTLQNQSFQPPRDQDERYLQVTARVEALFRTALTSAFPPSIPGARIALREFEQTFAGFLSGELALSTLAPLACDDPIALHGIPDGAHYFCFAESALLFTRLGLEPNFWRPLLRSFVCGARFFAANYWRRAERIWTGYSPQTCVRTSSEAILAMLDQYYAPMVEQQLAADFGQTLAIALSDEPSLPRTMPSAPEFQ